MASGSLVGEIRDEFADSDLKDWRLRHRLVRLAESLDVSPDASLPKATKTTAAREGMYRFLGNFRVTAEAILSPHRRATAQRCREAGRVYVVSDTTEFIFTGEERGRRLGRISGTRRGFLGHFALAVSADGRRCPLGVLGIDQIVRSEEKKNYRDVREQKRNPERESLRWCAMVEHVESSLEATEAIHVMDREADIYELMADMIAKGRRFIVRSAQNRLVEDGKLFEVLPGAPALLQREVALSARPGKGTPSSPLRRAHPPRQARMASLSISSRRVTFQRPRSTAKSYARSFEVNVVHVLEHDPPPDQDAVEWVLLTSEPISTADDVAAVVDGYRTRWTIEEYFKALKTGCAYEQRQLESFETLSKSLAIFAVIAWRLLLLRTLHRDAPSTPASSVMDPLLLEALPVLLKRNGEKKLPPANPSVADAMEAIARLGAHIKSNGPPGWQVLWRGYHDLLTFGAGFIAGRSTTYRDQS
jgi:hypothetical protein